MDTASKAGTRKGRLNYPREFKERLARAASMEGISVSNLALEHGVNANMLFKWRRQLKAGLFDRTPESPAVLLPVSIKEAAPILRRPPSPSAGSIEITFAHAKVRIDGAVDPSVIAAVLRALHA